MIVKCDTEHREREIIATCWFIVEFVFVYAVSEFGIPNLWIYTLLVGVLCIWKPVLYVLFVHVLCRKSVGFSCMVRWV